MMTLNHQTIARSRYLPPQDSTIRTIVHGAYMRFVYDIWRRNMMYYGRWQSNEHIRILDCGCGPGYLLSMMEKWYPQAYCIGLDIESQLLENARERTTRATFVQASAEQIPIYNESYDAVFALHLIEHLPRPSLFIGGVRRILKERGLLILATPNLSGIGARLMGSRWNGYSDESHVALNGAKYWRKLLEDQGFHIISDGTTGLSGIPIFRKLPLALVNWSILFTVGFLPWSYGEAYICIATPSQE